MMEQPLRLELVESSGPVSPRFQYAITIVFQREEARIAFTYRDKGRKKIDIARDVDENTFAEFWRALVEAGVMDAGGDLVGEKRTRVGVSFNHLEITFASSAVRLDYLLLDLDDPENESRKSIISLVKQTAEKLAAP